MTTTDKIEQYWDKATPMTFRKEKWSYDDRRAFRYGLQDYMHNAIQFNDYKDKRVLEIGCGGGIDLLEFGRSGAKMYGMDITHNAIRVTYDTCEEANKLAVLSKASADNIPYVDDFFDVVYSFGVLHHIPNIDDALKEINRVLKPDGQLIVMLYNKDSLLYAYSIVHLHKCEGTEDELISRYSERIEGCPYTKAYTKQEAIGTFSRYFREVEVKTYFPVIDTPKQRKVKCGGTEECDYGWHHIIKAKK